MDIIMPNCDGISATVYIRAVNSQVPIIAMTSNIRQEDISSYYSWGKHSLARFVAKHTGLTMQQE